jgi:hypothetical protein
MFDVISGGAKKLIKSGQNFSLNFFFQFCLKNFNIEQKFSILLISKNFSFALKISILNKQSQFCPKLSSKNLSFALKILVLH